MWGGRPSRNHLIRRITQLEVGSTPTPGGPWQGGGVWGAGRRGSGEGSGICCPAAGIQNSTPPGFPKMGGGRSFCDPRKERVPPTHPPHHHPPHVNSCDRAFPAPGLGEPGRMGGSWAALRRPRSLGPGALEAAGVGCSEGQTRTASPRPPPSARTQDTSVPGLVRQVEVDLGSLEVGTL